MIVRSRKIEDSSQGLDAPSIDERTRSYLLTTTSRKSLKKGPDARVAGSLSLTVKIIHSRTHRQDLRLQAAEKEKERRKERERERDRLSKFLKDPAAQRRYDIG